MKVTGVSYSSDKKLARCEQQYSYRYDQQLRRKVKKLGLFRGDWLHELLQAYREKKDWKKRWRELKKERWDKLFDEEKENYGPDFPQGVYDLMEHYVEYWGERDKDLKVVQIEKSYELMTKFGWPVRWKSDYIVKDGKVVVLFENKNKKKIPESNERILAPQVHAYCFLLSKVGIKIDRIVWDYMRTEPVPRPKILKDGSLSTRKIQTDQRSYLAAMKEAGIHLESEEDIIGLENHLKGLPETLSLLRVTNTPNLKVGELFVRDWIDRARRAEKIKRPTRNWNSSCRWDCDYKDLCQIDMLGKSRDLEIKKNFEPRRHSESSTR